MSDKDEASGGDSQAMGFADDLEKAFAEFEEAEAGTDDGQSETEVEAKAADEAEEGEGEETGEDNEAETMEAADDGEQSEEEAEVDESGEDEGEDDTLAVDAPEHWSDADKESFKGLPDEAKPLYLDKVKSLESGFNRKFEELATERKELEPYKGFHDLFKPFEQELATVGTTAEQYTRQLVATALQMRGENKVETFKALAANHGIDLNELVGKPTGADEELDEEFLDPAVKALKQENAALRQELQGLSTEVRQTQNSQRQASSDSVLKEWAIFAGSKDEQGNELYPEAENLRAMVGDELTRNPPGLTETSQDAFKRAYETVKWLDPNLRQSILDAEAEKARNEGKTEAQKALEAKQKEAQRKADVGKAKQAGRVVKSKSAPVSEAPIESASWRDEVEKQWDEAAA